MKIEDLPFQGKKVLIRVDFNVPLNDEGEITDDTRIRAALETIEYVLKKGGRAILMSHLGRPKGKKDSKYSLKPCAERLSKLLGQKVELAPDCVGKNIEKKVNSLEDGQVLLLENLRFHLAEEKPEEDPQFAKDLATLGDFYVNDAFGTAHRAHSSTATIANYFKGRSAPGFLLRKEIEFLGKHFNQPKHPFYALIGGAKISSKLGVLRSLLSKVDALFIGGGMAYTFLKVRGISIGNSLFEKNLIDEAEKFLNQAEEKKIPIFLPEDIKIAKEFSNDSEQKIISTSQGIPDGWEGMDIGPETVKHWENTLQNAQMIFWNGPLGVFEFPNFAEGTNALAKILANLHALTIIGGGDSVAAINQLDLSKKFSHISTGGGATLEYIEYGHLPGIDVLEN